jgi:hypothetical protein
MKLMTVSMAAAACVAISACGGGGGGNGVTVGGGTTSTDAGGVPQSALVSASALVAYMKQLIASGTSDAAEPLTLGDIALPVDNAAEPEAL